MKSLTYFLDFIFDQCQSLDQLQSDVNGGLLNVQSQDGVHPRPTGCYVRQEGVLPPPSLNTRLLLKLLLVL